MADIPQTPAAVIDAFTAAELARMRRKIDSIRGVGVRTGPDWIVIEPPPGGGKATVAAPGASSEIPFKISSIVTSQIGRYNAKSFTVSTTAAATGNLTEANIGTLATTDDCVVWHVPEIALSSAKHLLKTGVVYLGRSAGTTSTGQKIILFGALPVGETASPKSLVGSGLTADATTWSRATDGTPLTLKIASRAPQWDGTNNILYGYERTLTLDAVGIPISATAETRQTVDTATSCTGTAAFNGGTF